MPESPIIRNRRRPSPKSQREQPARRRLPCNRQAPDRSMCGSDRTTHTPVPVPNTITPARQLCATVPTTARPSPKPPHTRTPAATSKTALAATSKTTPDTSHASGTDTRARLQWEYVLSRPGTPDHPAPRTAEGHPRTIPKPSRTARITPETPRPPSHRGNPLSNRPDPLRAIPTARHFRPEAISNWKHSTDPHTHKKTGSPSQKETPQAKRSYERIRNRCRRGC